MRNRKLTFIAVIAVSLTVGGVWYSNRAVPPGPATWDDVLAESKAGGYRIITTGELSKRYVENAKSLFLVDTRQEWEYRTGRIPGAVNFPMEPTAWSRWRKASALKAFLGPDKGRTLIFY